MQTVERYSISVQSGGDRQIHSRIEGDGKPVVLFHGIAASNLDWEFIAPLLVRGGYRAIRPDLPGHGESAKPNDPTWYTFDRLYRLVYSWLEELHLDTEPVLIGHSLGGLLALRLALDSPDRVSKIVLIDPYFHHQQLSPFLRFVNRRPELCGKALETAPPWLIHAAITLDVNSVFQYDARTRRQIALDYKRASPHIVHLARTIPDFTDDLRRITQPTLVIWGEKDLTLAPRSFIRLLEKLPKAQGFPIPGTGHQPHLAQPAKVNPLIIDFLGGSTHT